MLLDSTAVMDWYPNLRIERPVFDEMWRIIDEACVHWGEGVLTSTFAPTWASNAAYAEAYPFTDGTCPSPCARTPRARTLARVHPDSREVAAAFAGVPVTRTVVLVAMLSGALAGLAGAIEVAGRTSYVTLDMSPGYGYTGIVIAMLAALNPLGVMVAGVFVAGMLVGADSMSRAVGVPTYIADVIVAASLLSVLVASLLTQYRVVGKGRSA